MKDGAVVGLSSRREEEKSGVEPHAQSDLCRLTPQLGGNGFWSLELFSCRLLLSLTFNFIKTGSPLCPSPSLEPLASTPLFAALSRCSTWGTADTEVYEDYLHQEQNLRVTACPSL